MRPYRREFWMPIARAARQFSKVRPKGYAYFVYDDEDPAHEGIPILGCVLLRHTEGFATRLLGGERKKKRARGRSLN